VTEFEVDAGYAERYPIRTVGASLHRELWVPAEELADFNRHIIGAYASSPSSSDRELGARGEILGSAPLEERFEAQSDELRPAQPLSPSECIRALQKTALQGDENAFGSLADPRPSSLSTGAPQLAL
jgi:hypothetical protein